MKEKVPLVKHFDEWFAHSPKCFTNSETSFLEKRRLSGEGGSRMEKNTEYYKYLTSLRDTLKPRKDAASTPPFLKGQRPVGWVER